MLLNGDDIIQAKEDGEIVIDPYDERNVNTGSYDCCLGPFFYRQAYIPTMRNIYDMYSEEYINKSWYLCKAILAKEDEIYLKCTARAVRTSNFYYRLDSISPDDYIIWIGPGEIILAHTLEFIGSVAQPSGTISITTQMHSRSSSVRNCIDVCGSGGWGDHGFCSRWTMEIVNHSQHYNIPLVVGRRIAQIGFFRTAPIQRDYAKEGKYHSGLSLAELRKKWHPKMMLPKTPTDREVREGTPNKDLVKKLVESVSIEE